MDSMLCKDDPEGEAVWVLAENQLRQWGNQGLCLATEDGSDEATLKECGAVSEQDGWSTPKVGGAYNEVAAICNVPCSNHLGRQVKSLKQDLCLVPVEGFGSRSIKVMNPLHILDSQMFVQLQACGADASHWKMDQVDGKAGTCSIR